MQIALRNDGRELKSHGDHSFPVLVSPERLDAYEMGSFACHWHPEIEFTLILSGEILYCCGQVLNIKRLILLLS